MDNKVIPGRSKNRGALSAALEKSKNANRAASPAPNNGHLTSSKSELATTPSKRKRDAPGIVFSQPVNSGYGEEIQTQMAYAVEHLKRQDGPIPIQDILDYLSLSNRYSEEHQESLVNKMRQHPRIEFVPDRNMEVQTWRTGKYAHRPLIPGVKDKISLLRYLQQRTDAQGVQVKDLKDGWPNCEKALTELEKERKILVCRTKKDNVARQVFIDDPSLFHAIDLDFQKMWLSTVIPKPDELPRKLTAVGQKPTSDDPTLVKPAAPVKKQPKKRAVRKVGKATNEHMEALLRENGRFLPGMSTNKNW